MYNLCIFIVIIYAMSYSVSEILFKRKRTAVSAPKKKSHTANTSQLKHRKSKSLTSAKQTQQNTRQIKPSNKKTTSYKSQKARIGRKPMRALSFICNIN